MTTIPMRFQISKSFEQIVRLPGKNSFSFFKDDVLIEDRVLCYYKLKKKLFFTSFGRTENRDLIVSHDGHLIVYLEYESGFVFDIKSIQTLRSKKIPSKYPTPRTLLTLQFPFGKFYMVLVGEKIFEWMTILQGINAGMSNLSSCSLSSLASTIDSRRVHYSPSVVSLTSNNTDWNNLIFHEPTAPTRSPIEQEEDDNISVVESIRCGALPVPIMAEKLEQKINSVYEKKKKIALPNGSILKQTVKYDN